MFTCNLCNKTFIMPCRFKEHFKRHSVSKPMKHYGCQQCDKRFYRKEKLEIHSQTHNRSFQCTECEKCFNKSTNLKGHLMIHKDDKPFKCEDCGTGFKQVAHLNTHVSIHKEDKPFQCNICNKSFRLLAFTLPFVGNSDVIVTADVDAFIMSSDILLPLSIVRY